MYYLHLLPIIYLDTRLSIKSCFCGISHKKKHFEFSNRTYVFRNKRLSAYIFPQLETWSNFSAPILASTSRASSRSITNWSSNHSSFRGLFCHASQSKSFRGLDIWANWSADFSREFDSFESTGPFGQFFLNFFVKSPCTNNLLWDVIDPFGTAKCGYFGGPFGQKLSWNRFLWIGKTLALWPHFFTAPLEWLLSLQCTDCTFRLRKISLFLFIFKIPQISTNPQNSLYRQTTDIYFQKICFENKNGNNCNRNIFWFIYMLHTPKKT